jgi:tRNA nucleotidyltransferase/poly(A) polymerase
MKAIQILKKLNRDTGAEVYYAGEYARDIVRRKRSGKIEILVRNLPFDQIVKYLKQHFSRVYASKARNLINFASDNVEVMIRLPEKGNKRSPYFSLREDAKGRDFSINAMYFPIYSKKKNSIIDFYRGRSCIQQRKIKTIGKPDAAIKRNPIVMMRAISLSAKLNYMLDNNLFYAIKSNHKLIENQPVPKVREAFTHIILSPRPSKHLRTMHKSGLLNILIPELSIGAGVTQNKKYHRYDVFDHCLTSCDSTDPDLTLRLAALLHDVGKPQAREEALKNGQTRVTFYNHEVLSSKLAKRILRRLGFSKGLIYDVGELIYNHMYNYEPDKWSDAAVRRFIKKVHITSVDLNNLENLPVFLLRKADRAANGLNLSKISPRQRAFEKRIREVYTKSEALHITDLKIDGEVLMKAFNLKQGPTIGHILRYLLSKVIEDQKMNDPKILIEESCRYLSKALK